MTPQDIADLVNKYFPDAASFEAMLKNAALTIQIKQVEIKIKALDAQSALAQKPINDARTELMNEHQALLDTMAALIPAPAPQS